MMKQPCSSSIQINLVLGQPNFTSNTLNNGGRTGATLYSPLGVSTEGNYLLVGDYENHRILIWNSLSTITSGQAADVVVGQADPNTALAASTIDRVRYPYTAIINGGKLYISERGNNRILIFDTIPVANGASATHIIGQTNVGTTTANQNGMTGWSLSAPSGMYFQNGLLHITDSYNDRIIAINPGL